MDSFNFEKLDMPKPQLKILCDGTILLYMKCIDEVKINKSQNVSMTLIMYLIV